jgi:hypothetical protein
MMDVYVTFFSSSGRSLFVNNGFSFGRVKGPGDVDLFIDSGVGRAGVRVLENELKRLKPERVFASLSFEQEWLIVSALADERWVVGGPLAAILGRRKPFPGKLTGSSLESYFGRPISATFDPYFMPFVHKARSVGGFVELVANCSLGNECYWRKCEFCDYKDFGASVEPFNRGDPSVVLSGVPPAAEFGVSSAFYHCGVLSATTKQLEGVVRAEKRGNLYGLFVRADEAIVDKVLGFADMSGVMLEIGLEAFSQAGMDELNKGTKLSVGKELIGEALARGAHVSCLWIDKLPFMTRAMVEESVRTIGVIREIVESNPGGKERFSYFSNPFLGWPDGMEDKAARYGEYVPLMAVVGGFVNVLTPEVEKLNQEVRRAVYNSGVQVWGS